MVKPRLFRGSVMFVSMDVVALSGKLALRIGEMPQLS